MKFSPGYFLVTLSFALLGISTVCGQATTSAPPSNQTNYFYNGTTSLLSLDRKLPITITINQLKNASGVISLIPLAKVNFVDAAKVLTNLCSYSYLCKCQKTSMNKPDFVVPKPSKYEAGTYENAWFLNPDK